MSLAGVLVNRVGTQEWPNVGRAILLGLSFDVTVIRNRQDVITIILEFWPMDRIRLGFTS